MKQNAEKVKRKKIGLIALAAAALLLAGFAGYAAYGNYRLSQLEKLSFEAMIAYTAAGKPEARITVGVIRDGESSFTVYGEDGKILPSEAQAYEIGSITKTLAAALICKAVSEGKLSLSDSIDRYLTLPEKACYPTIQRLLTHTSGYKEYYFESPMISNFLHGRNDYCGITKDMLLDRVGKTDLEDQEYAFVYSSFGYAVLGLVLEQVYEEDFTVLVNTWLQQELLLSHTEVSDGGLSAAWAWKAGDAYIPAGALTSDISDMLQYAQMLLDSRPAYFAQCSVPMAEIDAASAAYKAMGINMDSIGTGWIFDNENGIIWHNGGTGSYNSYIGFNPDCQSAVVVLSNLPPDYRIPATVVGIKRMLSD